MSPRNFSSSGSFFDSILSTSIHSLCAAETVPRVSSPSYPMCGDVATDCAKTVSTDDNEGGHQALSSKQGSNDNNTPTLTTVAPTPMRPPPPKGSTTQQRNKRPGLSVIIPPSPSDVHSAPPRCPVSLMKHVELKKKLSERHFLFRPVSDDDQSKATSAHTKTTEGTRAAF
mmetsp:Transcript_1531/g.2096  ORF Transcript_1531/g.2096 Transcript_1531/m.2096 type:complete len:171 (+) Transcript_1531:132-644(+)